jgi:hypothetical protein
MKNYKNLVPTFIIIFAISCSGETQSRIQNLEGKSKNSCSTEKLFPIENEMNLTIFNAAKVNDKKLVNEILSKGVDLRYAIYGAIDGGNNQLVYSLIDKGGSISTVLEWIMATKHIKQNCNSYNLTNHAKLIEGLLDDKNYKSELIYLH